MTYSIHDLELTVDRLRLELAGKAERIEQLEYDLAAHLPVSSPSSESGGANQPALRAELRGDDGWQPRPPGCTCFQEAGDSACSVHPPGAEELAYAAAGGTPYRMPVVEPWRCPVESNECTIRRRCTNKCGAHRDVKPSNVIDPRLLPSVCLAETIGDAEAMAAWEYDPNEQPTCVRCHSTFTVDTGDGIEIGPLCHGCAQMIVGDVPGLVGHIAALVAEIERLDQQRTGAGDALVVVTAERDRLRVEVEDARRLVGDGLAAVKSKGAEVKRLGVDLECERMRSADRGGSYVLMTGERDAYRAMVCDLLASASPSERDHPSMSRQWARARELLKNGPPAPVPGFRNEVP